MVFITIEPIRLKKMLRSSMPLSKQQLCLINFTQEKVQVNYAYDRLIILANFEPKFFVEYKCPEDELMIISRDMLKELNYGIRGEYLKVWTNDEGLHVEGDKFDDKLWFKKIPKSENVKFPIVQQRIIANNLLMPIIDGKELHFNVHALTSIKRLKRKYFRSLKSTISLLWDGDALYVFIRKTKGQSLFKLLPERFLVAGEPACGFFKQSDLLDLSKKFKGKVWLGLCNVGLTLSQTTNDSKLTYIFVAEKMVV